MLNVYGGFVFSNLSAAHWSASLQEKRRYDWQALPQWPLLRSLVTVSEVSGRSGGDGVKLLSQKPCLPQERQYIHDHQSHNPELLP